MTSNMYLCSEATPDEVVYLFNPCADDLLTHERVAAIQAAIEPLKQIRFQLEKEGNLTGLQQLEDLLLTELDLLEATKWGVQHRKTSAIFEIVTHSKTEMTALRQIWTVEYESCPEDDQLPEAILIDVEAETEDKAIEVANQQVCLSSVQFKDVFKVD